MPENIYEIHYSLSEKIRGNYAKRNDSQKYLDAAIQACEEQIKISKDIAQKILEGEKQFTFKSDKEMINEFKKENAKDIEIVRQFNAGIKNINTGNIQNQRPENKYTGMKMPEGFNPAIHKSPDDFVVKPRKLGEHTGYKQLCIIRENQGNFAEVIKLAEQAKSEGWAGDWDKRIEKARKKLEKQVSQNGTKNTNPK
jgi:hypothetical protein